MQINNNSRTNFGMAYKMKDVPVASRRIAEYIESYRNPRVVEEYFTEKIAKPIKGLKTIVTTDGDKVTIEHPLSKKQFEVLDCPAWSEESSNGKAINYVVQDLQDGSTQNIEVRYPESQNRIGSIVWDSGVGVHTGIIRKHINALEIAKKFDEDLVADLQKKAADTAKSESITATSSRLSKLSD